ncbi:MAG TPA: phosphate signaling complex protein PhoU [Actinomycetota bacterium]|nr:phosphate signaling complex protein PhoU [Actinomycetota bacterium]
MRRESSTGGGQPRTAPRHFHNELRDLEVEVQEMATAAHGLVQQAVTGLARDDAEILSRVISGDDEIDRFYLSIEERILDLFALQTPVASDLRFLTVVLHLNLHLERIADVAVNMAKLAQLASDLPRDSEVVSHLEEMGTIALQMMSTAMDAFARRDLSLALELPAMDDPIDRLNRGMFQKILSLASDTKMLEWGIRMHVVSRQIERIGDHAVDIGEQLAFLITGEFREFTDASHPSAE